MDDSSGAPDGESSSDPSTRVRLPEVVTIASNGDIILDVTFENSKDTVVAARRALPKLASQEPQPVPKARVRLAFRVDLGVLKGQSKYFEKLLGDARFRETKDILSAFAALSVRNIKPSTADAQELPWVKIHDDDEATHYANRDGAFADLLRILHGQEVATKVVSMPFVSTLAVLADRFDCTGAISKYISTGLKFKWPVTSRKPVRDEVSSMSRNNENILRQKILVSWLLNQPGKFQAATRELIMNGSCRWRSFNEEEDESSDATWWYLQDGLEQELQYRRHGVLNTIASVQRHFMSLYASRTQQCKLGYDSSAACDSYQLGEMFKFLTKKNLMFLVDFSPGSYDTITDTALLQVDAVLSTLRQCPSYQIDKNHTNCGLRTKMLPVLDFIQGLLSANSVPISRGAWKGNRRATAWMPSDGEDAKTQDEGEPFRYTRSLAGDQRLRFENAMGADKFAKDVFTAPSWDWTADDQGQEGLRFSSTPKWSWR
ncbi:Uu.00g073030.m01.CDS01 [Anthostomella pinea]|uniref:Uu.00g073030.m01.CDS01 n=1 Tax=Anthostomella pinea TaxID=933095 RepID=A0AAI8VV89_9PEZI|nr:Uu.00g073030.m01.CDS01 [Anthostomella pinea]